MNQFYILKIILSTPEIFAAIFKNASAINLNRIFILLTQFSAPGGLIEIAIGGYLKLGKVPGTKILKFDEASQKHGLIMIIIGAVSLIAFNVLTRL